MKVVTLNFCLGPWGGNMKYAGIYLIGVLLALIPLFASIFSFLSLAFRIPLVALAVYTTSPVISHLLSIL